ncbi:MBL fold metallo-hydrolase [Opitutaceae bacterium EW11]|nr:MBL fold metallo-hydrolase [Opitutaceae bacterium EW11]
MNLHVLAAGPLQTNAYLLSAPERKEAVLIDAPLGVWADLQPVLAKNGCSLVELWLTHGHFDHMEGAAEVVAATKARVRAHPADRNLFESPGMMKWFIDMFLPGHPDIRPVHPDSWVEGGATFECLGETVEVRHVPGHADGNVVFYLPKLAMAFVGDSLFAGSIGRTDLPGGSFEVLESSIRQQLYTMPDSVVIYPGHGPKSTIGAEKRGNPYVQP